MTHEARQYLWLRIGVIGTGVAVLTALVVSSVRLWPVVSRAMFPTKLSCGCATLAIHAPWWMIGLAVAVTLMTIYSLTRLAIHLITHIHRSRKQRSQLMIQKDIQSWNTVDLTSIEVVETTDPVAMTIGLLQPRVIVSLSLLRRLNETELRAVLAHEDAHRVAHDPLVIAIMDSVLRAIHWLPGTNGWMKVAYSWRELAADAAATHGYTSTTALSSAFLKLSDVRVMPSISAFSPNRDRLEKLLDHGWSGPKRWWNWTALSAVSLVLGGILFIGHYVQAENPVVPAAATTACHQTIVMCRENNLPTLSTDVQCTIGRCTAPLQLSSFQSHATITP